VLNRWNISSPKQNGQIIQTRRKKQNKHSPRISLPEIPIFSSTPPTAAHLALKASEGRKEIIKHTCAVHLAARKPLPALPLLAKR
jgi:hypothetical protein